MIFQRLQSGLKIRDCDFDVVYTERIRAVSEFYFTPVEVAISTARFLVEKPGAKVLDVGSGAGKFCLIGAACTGGHFTGVEYRKNLHRLSERLARRYGLSNTTFLFSNITVIDFQAFDAFYLFNPFYENIVPANPIDYSVRLDKYLYFTYSEYVKGQLDAMPVGTRLATYFSYLDEVPDSYKIQCTDFDRKLKLWEKVV